MLDDGLVVGGKKERERNERDLVFDGLLSKCPQMPGAHNSIQFFSYVRHHLLLLKYALEESWLGSGGVTLRNSTLGCS